MWKGNTNVSVGNKNPNFDELINFAFDYCLVDGYDANVYGNLLFVNDLSMKNQELVIKQYFHLKSKNLETLERAKHLSQTISFLRK